MTGESFDPARHPERTAVKAATYHQLSIVPVKMAGRPRWCWICNHRWSEKSFAGCALGIGVIVHGRQRHEQGQCQESAD